MRNSITQTATVTAFTWLFGAISVSAAWAQVEFPKLRALRAIVDAKTGVVLPDPSLHEKGDKGLVLPDGSVIATVWPATLQLSTYQGSTLPKRPVEHICEPGVYSLARYTEAGKELWAKSYIFKGKSDTVCFNYYLGFDVFSQLQEVSELGYYSLPFNGRIVIGGYIDTSVNKFEINVKTGEIFGVKPENLLVIDAYELRDIKERIYSDLFKKYPEPDVPMNISEKSRNEFGHLRKNHEYLRYQLFFKQLEAALFN